MSNAIPIGLKKKMALGAASLFALALVTASLGLLQVTSFSMEPTLHDGDIIVMVRRLATFRLIEHYRGEIVVIRPPGYVTLAVKRIVALPGETVCIAGGRLFVNGSIQPEPWLESGRTAGRDWPMDALESGTLGVRVPPGRYFVLGDNRDKAMDSRQWGPLLWSDLVGVVIGIFPVRQAAAEPASLIPGVVSRPFHSTYCTGRTAAGRS